MIKFDLILLNNESVENNDNSDVITKANAEAQKVVAVLNTRYSMYKCRKHPRRTNRVRIMATSNGDVQAKFTCLCCNELFPKSFK